MNDKELLAYTLELEKKQRLIVEAFKLACKCLREHPPADTCDHIELVQMVMNAKEDPEGKRWMAKFLHEADLKLNEGKELYASESSN